jgi:DNA polymerase-3 subunit alpha
MRSSIIEDKDFVDYFLVISDAVRWAKDHDIGVGPCARKRAGSLACWLLRITEVNPMLYPTTSSSNGSSMSRAGPARHRYRLQLRSARRCTTTSSPSTARSSVGNVGTFTKYKGKNSLDAAARVFHVPKWETTRSRTSSLNGAQVTYVRLLPLRIRLSSSLRLARSLRSTQTWGSP